LKNQALKKLYEITKKIYRQMHQKTLGNIQPSRQTSKSKVVFAMIVLICLSGLLVFQALSAFTTSTTISNTGTLKAVGVGVYFDAGMTNRATTVDWGMLEPGTQKTVTVYVRNEGNSPLTLTLSTSNWSPSTASSYLTVTWNYDGQAINAGANLKVVLTLTTSSSIIGVSNFNFNLIITGTG
jgi:uncharacterized membrane protein